MLLAQQKTAEELMRQADQDAFQGYLFAGIAVFILLFGVGLSIYLDRRKKAGLKAK
jgi:hypothetical protein